MAITLTPIDSLMISDEVVQTLKSVDDKLGTVEGCLEYLEQHGTLAGGVITKKAAEFVEERLRQDGHKWSTEGQPQQAEPAAEAPVDETDDLLKELEQLRKIRQHHDECEAKQREYRELLSEHKVKKAQADALKKEADAINEELLDMIRRGPQQPMLFNKHEATAASDSNGKPEASSDEDDSWRDVALSDLRGLTNAMLLKLAEHNPAIETIGQLADWTAEHPLTDVKGIGEAAATKIDEVLEHFWATRKAEQEQTEATDEAPDTLPMLDEG